MIYLIHGEDVVSSKNFLLKLRSEYSGFDQVSFKNIKNIANALPAGKGLFSEKKLVLIESFPLKKDFSLPKDLDFDVLLWFPETVYPPSWVEKTWYFKSNSTYSNFAFADLVAYGQEKQALKLLKELLNSPKEREMLIGTLVRQFRLLSLCLQGEVAEVSKSSIVQNKISDQARNWNLKKLRVGLIYLLKTDLWLKQGQLSAETLFTNLTLDLCRLSLS